MNYSRVDEHLRVLHHLRVVSWDQSEEELSELDHEDDVELANAG